MFQYSDPTSQMHCGCLQVQKFNQSGSYNYSYSCAYSASSSIISSVLAQNDTSYTATASIKFDDYFPVASLTHAFQSSYDYMYKTEPQYGAFLSMIVIIVLFFIGIASPVFEPLKAERLSAETVLVNIAVPTECTQ